MLVLCNVKHHAEPTEVYDTTLYTFTLYTVVCQITLGSINQSYGFV